MRGDTGSRWKSLSKPYSGFTAVWSSSPHDGMSPCSAGLQFPFPCSINRDPCRIRVYRLGAPTTLGSLRPYQDPLLTVLGCHCLMCSALEPTRFQHRKSEKLRNAETWMEDPWSATYQPRPRTPGHTERKQCRNLETEPAGRKCWERGGAGNARLGTQCYGDHGVEKSGSVHVRLISRSLYIAGVLAPGRVCCGGFRLYLDYKSVYLGY